MRLAVRYALSGPRRHDDHHDADVPVRSAAPDLPQRLRWQRADADRFWMRTHDVRVFRRHASGLRSRSCSGSCRPAFITSSIGPDHLLFLVGLLLLGGTVRQLAVIVTAFTVAHSITLSLAALNIVSPPARIIEPAIALEHRVCRRRQPADPRRPRCPRVDRVRLRLHPRLRLRRASCAIWICRRARSAGRCSRSTSAVEIGQLLVVAVVATALAALRSRSEAAGRQLAFAGSIVVMATGAVWFIQRVFFPGGI